MPGCVLHVTGERFDVSAFLVGSDLQPYFIHHCGEHHRRGISSNSGVHYSVSNADGKLDAEIVDAIHFLSVHERELERLRDFPGVTNLILDFGHYRRDVVAQFDYLPPELISRAGKLGIGIELSLYPKPIGQDY